MTIGTGIFLSSILLFIAVIYYLTRDRLKWKKIIGYGTGVIIIGVIGMASFLYYDSLPKKLSGLDGIELGDTEQSVILKKGKPSHRKIIEENEKTAFYYRDELSDTPEFLVRLTQEGKVDLVGAIKNNEINWFEANGVWLGMDYTNVVKRLGEPDSIDEGNSMVCHYRKFNMLIDIRDSEVIGIVVKVYH